MFLGVTQRVRTRFLPPKGGRVAARETRSVEKHIKGEQDEERVGSEWCEWGHEAVKSYRGCGDSDAGAGGLVWCQELELCHVPRGLHVLMCNMPCTGPLLSKRDTLWVPCPPEFCGGVTPPLRSDPARDGHNSFLSTTCSGWYLSSSPKKIAAGILMGQYLNART